MAARLGTSENNVTYAIAEACFDNSLRRVSWMKMTT
jgi:hypothetical protein